MTQKRSARGELLAQLRRGERATVHVDEAALVLEIGRIQALQAAHRGELPVLRLGKRMLVPVEPLLRMLEGERK